ncbi:MAG: staygreen family protein [Anaerolineae bacterium]
MGRLRPDLLHVKYAWGVGAEASLSEGPLVPRRYTLTHSDMTGELFLTIGPDYDREKISGLWARLMRDEVLAEWRQDEEGPALHVFCHVSGGLALGPPGWRYGIFRHELPLVLEAFRHGDRALYEARSALDGAPIVIHFRSAWRRYRRRERWGTPADYRIDALE